MDKKFLGIDLKWWLIGGALAVGIGLYLRHKATTAATTAPVGKQIRRPVKRRRIRRKA